ncbi:hypothetical protein [Salinibacter ruber]|jgi:hypothetical protein|uniref:hypothetical protein n=1 Tax=Salinibacter ruber TaxID=146919 RepID=UPI002169D1BA|nr:hypothetical protein [Salinibacter ruber]MCS4051313.1 hypothetical protein [Salinibacter ruber]
MTGELAIQGILLIAFSFGIGYWASTKGRSLLGWTAASLIATPLLTIVALLIMGTAESEDAAK